MKKKIVLALALIAFLSIFVALSLHAQDTIRIKHTNYITVFSKSKHYPVLVEWYATKAKVGCEKPLTRKDNFQPDPKLPTETDLKVDYVGSGTDRGHMCPAADNLCQTPAVQDECFYFSNMAAQYHSLNAGDWKSLETLSRQLALVNDSIHIWCGNIGEAKRVGKVAVPKQCWKVIYIVKSKEYQAYIFNNTTDKPTGLHSHQVTVDDITKLTGFKFGK
jgi:endonuclease G, mitochondrial